MLSNLSRSFLPSPFFLPAAAMAVLWLLVRMDPKGSSIRFGSVGFVSRMRSIM